MANVVTTTPFSSGAYFETSQEGIYAPNSNRKPSGGHEMDFALASYTKFELTSSLPMDDYTIIGIQQDSRFRFKQIFCGYTIAPSGSVTGMFDMRVAFWKGSLQQLFGANFVAGQKLLEMPICQDHVLANDTQSHSWNRGGYDSSPFYSAQRAECDNMVFSIPNQQTTVWVQHPIFDIEIVCDCITVQLTTRLTNLYHLSPFILASRGFTRPRQMYHEFNFESL